MGQCQLTADTIDATGRRHSNNGSTAGGTGRATTPSIALQSTGNLLFLLQHVRLRQKLRYFIANEMNVDSKKKSNSHRVVLHPRWTALNCLDFWIDVQEFSRLSQSSFKDYRACVLFERYLMHGTVRQIPISINVTDECSALLFNGRVEHVQGDIFANAEAEALDFLVAEIYPIFEKSCQSLNYILEESLMMIKAIRNSALISNVNYLSHDQELLANIMKKILIKNEYQQLFKAYLSQVGDLNMLLAYNQAVDLTEQMHAIRSILNEEVRLHVVLRVASQFYDQYLAETAPFHISITQATSGDVLSRFANNRFIETELFLPVMHELFAYLLRSHLDNFMRTEEYRHLMRSDRRSVVLMHHQLSRSRGMTSLPLLRDTPGGSGCSEEYSDQIIQLDDSSGKENPLKMTILSQVGHHEHSSHCNIVAASCDDYSLGQRKGSLLSLFGINSRRASAYEAVSSPFVSRKMPQSAWRSTSSDQQGAGNVEDNFSHQLDVDAVELRELKNFLRSGYDGIFGRFLETQSALSLMYFYQSASRFENSSFNHEVERISECSLLYDRYVSRNAEQPVPLPEPMRKDIVRKLFRAPDDIYSNALRWSIEYLCISYWSRFKREVNEHALAAAAAHDKQQRKFRSPAEGSSWYSAADSEDDATRMSSIKQRGSHALDGNDHDSEHRRLTHTSDNSLNSFVQRTGKTSRVISTSDQQRNDAAGNALIDGEGYTITSSPIGANDEKYSHAITSDCIKRYCGDGAKHQKDNTSGIHINTSRKSADFEQVGEVAEFASRAAVIYPPLKRREEEYGCTAATPYAVEGALTLAVGSSTKSLSGPTALFRNNIGDSRINRRSSITERNEICTSRRAMLINPMKRILPVVDMLTSSAASATDSSFDSAVPSPSKSNSAIKSPQSTRKPVNVVERINNSLATPDKPGFLGTPSLSYGVDESVSRISTPERGDNRVVNDMADDPATLSVDCFRKGSLHNSSKWNKVSIVPPAIQIPELKQENPSKDVEHLHFSDRFRTFFATIAVQSQHVYPTANEVLEHPQCCSIFKAFLEGEGLAQTLLYFVEVQEFRRIPHANFQHQRARKIFNKYIDEFAPMAVPIQSDTRQEVSTALTGGIIPPTLFSKATDEVLRYIEMFQYPSFQQSVDMHTVVGIFTAEVFSKTNTKRRRSLSIRGVQLTDVRSLKAILRNPMSMRFFKDFCARTYCAENVLFWLDVEHYRDLPGGDYMRRVACKIYQKYIADDARMQVNMSFTIKETIFNNLLSSNRHLFQKAQEEVFMLMKADTLPKFFKSKEYMAMMECVEESSTSVSSAGNIPQIAKRSPLAALRYTKKPKKISFLLRNNSLAIDDDHKRALSST